MNSSSAQKHCATCGRPLHQNATVCQHCGTPVENSSASDIASAPTLLITTPQAKKSKSRSLVLPIGILAGVLCVCLVAAAVIYFAANNASRLASIIPQLALQSTLSPVITPTVSIPTVVIPTVVIPTAIIPTAVVPTAVIPTAVIPATVVPATALPTVAAQPAATSALAITEDFTDDFSDPASGWKVVDTDAYTLQYMKPSGYQILLKQSNYFVFSSRSINYKDVIVATRGRLGSQLGSYLGVLCRYVDSTHYYAVSVAADSYNIGKQSGDKWIDLTQPAWIKYAAPLPDNGGILSVAFSCIADKLTLTVNDAAQLPISDSEFAEGGVGLAAGSGQAADANNIYADAQFLEFSTGVPAP